MLQGWTFRMHIQSFLKGVPLVPSGYQGPTGMQPLADSASQCSPSRGREASPVSNAEEINLGIVS